MPSEPRREFDVVLYGATGYTGRLIAHELDRCEGIRYAIAGRDRAKLAALAADLKPGTETIVASLDQAEALEQMAGRAKVLLAAAGPFQRTGPALLNAALAAKTHFTDITGEQSWIRLAAAHDAAARAAGVAIINATGFDVVPSDLAAALACEGVGDVSTLDIAIASRAQTSRGTRRTMAASAGAGWWYRDGHFRPGPPGRFRRTFRFPEPLGQREAAFIPWGDVATAPRTTGARTVRTFFTMPRKQARQLSLSWPVMGLIGQVPGVAHFLESRASGAEEGASPEARAKATFTILAEATRASDGRIQRGIVRGRDPYGLTAFTAARFAIALADGTITGRGALTPVQALGVDGVVALLHERGVMASVEGRLSTVGAHHFETAYKGHPPWDIGKPQPAFEALAEAGRVEGPVLDVGCGTGELAIWLADRGLDVTGVDLVEAAVRLAKRKAREQGSKATFRTADAMEPGALGTGYGTVVDTGVLHVFDPADRHVYVANVRNALADGGLYAALVFDRDRPLGPGPVGLTETELRDVFSKDAGWKDVQVERARFLTTFDEEDGSDAWFVTAVRAPAPPE